MARHVEADILIVGAGTAGLRAAAACLRKELRVLLLSAGPIGVGSASLDPRSTDPAQGWMDVPEREPERESMVQDILSAGLGHADPAAARELARRASAEFEALAALGVEFETGRRRGCFAGRSRAAVVADVSKLRDALRHRVRTRGVEILENTMATQLVAQEGRFLGAAAVDEAGEAVSIRAASCVLAAGGAAGVYARSIAPPGLVGGPFVLGHEAGASVKNLQFVEFVLAVLSDPPRPVRRKLADARFLDNRGRDLLQGIDAPAALRAEHYAFTAHDGTGAIDQALARAAGRGGCVMASRSGPEPVGHFALATNGGIVTDERGATGVRGLFACGGAAAGAHGALRVAGTALTEALVFGAAAGEAAAGYARDNPVTELSFEVEEPVRPQTGLQRGELLNYQKMVRDAMSAKAGVLRDPEELAAARAVASTALGVVCDKGYRSRELAALWHQTRHLAACARLMLGAMREAPSCGPHWVSR
jgi:L-aspartate oxidase